MPTVVVKFKKTNENAVIPLKNHEDDTGMDVTAVESKVIPARKSAVVDVGLEFAFISPKFWIKVEGRSGLGFKHGILPHPVLLIMGIGEMLGLSFIT